MKEVVHQLLEVVLMSVCVQKASLGLTVESVCNLKVNSRLFMLSCELEYYVG